LCEAPLERKSSGKTVLVARPSPSIHKFDDEHIHSGLSAALGHEPLGHELEAEWSEQRDSFCFENTLYLRIEALRKTRRKPIELKGIII